MGYTNLIKHDPNALPNKTLGFVIFKNSGKILGEHAFYPEVLDSVETAARKCGYNLNIITIERKEAEKADTVHIGCQLYWIHYICY